MDFGRYNKLWGALIGGVVGYALSWLAVQFPSIATCTLGPEGTQACAVIGISQADITAALVLAVASYGTWQAPPNQPPA